MSEQLPWAKEDPHAGSKLIFWLIVWLLCTWALSNIDPVSKKELEKTYDPYNQHY